MKKHFISSLKKTVILLVVCSFTMALALPEKDKGKYAKVKVIQHQQGKVNVYDTLLNTEASSVEDYLKGLGIDPKKANLLEIREENGANKQLIKKTKDKQLLKRRKTEQLHQEKEQLDVKIEKSIDEQGNVTIRKWVNGKEVPVDIENFEAEELEFNSKMDSLQKEDLHIEIVQEIEETATEDTNVFIRKSASEKEEGDPKGTRRIKIKKDHKPSFSDKEKHDEANMIWKSKENTIELETTDSFAIILQSEEEGSDEKVMFLHPQEDMTTVIVRYLDEASIAQDKPAFHNNENKQLRLNKLSFYPNPNQGVFQLTFELPQKAPAYLTIHKGENGGILVHEEKLSDQQQKYSKRIDLTQYGKGLYIMTIRQGDKSVIEKILMQ